MLLYNISNGLVNGLQGQFVRIEDGVLLVDFPKAGKVVSIQKRSWTLYEKGDPNKVIAKRTLYPLKPSFAITAQKSQRQTLEAAEVTSGNEFSHGQLYVALSHVKTKGRLSLKGFNLNQLIPPPKIGYIVK